MKFEKSDLKQSRMMELRPRSSPHSYSGDLTTPGHFDVERSGRRISPSMTSFIHCGKFAKSIPVRMRETLLEPADGAFFAMKSKFPP